LLFCFRLQKQTLNTPSCAAATTQMTTSSCSPATTTLAVAASRPAVRPRTAARAVASHGTPGHRRQQNETSQPESKTSTPQPRLQTTTIMARGSKGAAVVLGGAVAAGLAQVIPHGCNLRNYNVKVGPLALNPKTETPHANLEA